jgi:hypothetical protein
MVTAQSAKKGKVRLVIFISVSAFDASEVVDQSDVTCFVLGNFSFSGMPKGTYSH